MGSVQPAEEPKPIQSATHTHTFTHTHTHTFTHTHACNLQKEKGEEKTNKKLTRHWDANILRHINFYDVIRIYLCTLLEVNTWKCTLVWRAAIYFTSTTIQQLYNTKRHGDT